MSMHPHKFPNLQRAAVNFLYGGDFQPTQKNKNILRPKKT
jgi:hypothetical protein